MEKHKKVWKPVDADGNTFGPKCGAPGQVYCTDEDSEVTCPACRTVQVTHEK